MFQILQRLRRQSTPVAFDRADVDAGGSFDYMGLAAHCTTQNTFNRLHIELENVCAPVELAKLAELAGTLPKQAREWLQKLRLLEPRLLDDPRPFVRQPFGRQMFLYRHAESGPAGRGLIIAFTGNARRLMLPVSVFLQFVNPEKWDVLVLSKKVGNSYLDGLEEVATDFPGTVAHIGETLEPSPYRRLMTLGTSNGGFPAIWAALMTDAVRGVSICGALPNPVPASAVPQEPHPDLRFVYGRESARDHAAALGLHGVYGGRLLAIPDAETHNVMSVLLARGGLVAFMDEMLS